MSETIINAILRLAKDVEIQDQAHAEEIYVDALRWADDSFGKHNTESGMILFALMDLYDRQKRFEESEQLLERIRSILVLNAVKNGLLLPGQGFLL